MGLTRGRVTTSKLEIPEGALKEMKFLFHHNIVLKGDEFNIPELLIININQALTKHGGIKEKVNFPVLDFCINFI